MSGIPSEFREGLHRAFRLGRPLPRVAMEVGPSINGWTLRAAQVVVAVGAGFLVLTGSFQWSAAAVAIVFLLARPTAVLSAGYAGGLGFALLLQPFDPASLQPYLALFLIHLIVVLGTAIGRLSPSARYEWRALASRGATFLVVQLVSQCTALAIFGLGTNRPALTWVAVTAGIALAALVWIVFAVTNTVAVRAQRRRV